MSKLIYVPLEHIEGRYTIHMDAAIEEYLNRENIEYIKIMPTYDTPPLPEGQFLNSAFTSKFKALQMAEISDMVERGVITDGDTFFFNDNGNIIKRFTPKANTMIEFNSRILHASSNPTQGPRYVLNTVMSDSLLGLD